MRETHINETDTLNIHAMPMTCVIYESEFDGADIVTDVAKASTNGGFNAGILRRALWAMAKTASPATVPSYKAWMNGLSRINYGEGAEWMGDVMQEANEAFFRTASQPSDTQG